MKLEDLTKTQIILLCLLVSLVTSIATGITVVSLMDQNVNSITQPINKIIRETIERVVPTETKTVQTVIIKDEDLIIDSINKNIKNFIKIENGDVSANGILISKEGDIITSSSLLKEENDFTVSFNEKIFKAGLVHESISGVLSLKIIIPEDGEFKSFDFSNLKNASDLKSGQSIIAFQGEPLTIVSGIFSSLIDKKIPNPLFIIKDGTETMKEAENIPESLTFKVLNTDLKLSKNYDGNPILDLEGNVIGISIFNQEDSYIVPVDELKEFIK